VDLREIWRRNNNRKGKVKMGLKEVTSSFINAVGFDYDKNELTIQFKSGETYIYENVPRFVYDGLVGAASVGKYFKSNIDARYNFRRG
jgi:hypothetical protein